MPGAGTNATIAASGTYTVTYASPLSAASIASLTLGSAMVTLNIGAPSSNVAGAVSAINAVVSGLEVSGFGGTAGRQLRRFGFRQRRLAAGSVAIHRHQPV